MLGKAFTATCKWCLYLIAAVIILIALLAACVRFAMFYSDDYSEQLASLVSSYVGSPVEIGKVDIVWNRFDANASLKDVQIRSADGTETVLELPGLELQLNVRDILLQRNLSVRSVQLNKLSLAASYEGPGKLRMSGRLLGGDAADETVDNAAGKGAVDDADSTGQDDKDPKARGHSVLAWLFNAERISILDSNITLIDALNDRDYEVDNINIRVFNEGDQHQIRVSSALPDDIGGNSLAAFDFTGKADNISEWEGRFHLNTKGLNVNQLSDLWRKSEQQFDGQVDLQLWGEWRGTRVNELRVIASATEFKLQQPSFGGSYNAMLEADDVAVDLDWYRQDHGWQLAFNRLTGQLDNNNIQLDGLQMNYRRDAGDKVVTASGPDIDLELLRPVYLFADAMLPAETSFRTNALRRGQLKDWSISGSITEDTKTLSDLRATVVDLAIDPYQHSPGISDLTASVVFENGAGRVDIDNQSVSVSLPELYDKPLPVIDVDGVIKFLVNSDKPIADKLNSDPSVTAQPETAQVEWKAVSEDLRLSTPDLNTSVNFSVRGFPNGATLVDSRASILHANLVRLKDYLPVRVMKPKLANWLQNSITAGDVVRGRVEMQGNLNEFDPANGQGHFYAEADLVDATVKFRPDWPAAVGMDGNVSFSSSAMRGRVYKGALREARFSDARLLIPDLKQPVLEVQTNAIGPLADMLDFAQTGPLAAKIGKAFGNSTGSGTSRVALDVKIPLKKELSDALVVDGQIVLDNAQLNSADFGLDVESASGVVRFNKSGVSIDDLLVRYQGLPLQINAIQESEAGSNVNRIRVSGPVALASVMRSYNIPLVEQFEGTSNWNIDIDVTRPLHKKDNSKNEKARVELTATSDLSGTEFRFPVPLNKDADELREASVYVDFGAQEKDWWIELPGLMKTRVRMGDDKKLESMAIALGGSDNHVLPWRGIALHGDTHRLDAAGWVKLAMGFNKKESRQKQKESFPVFAKVSAAQMMVGDTVFDELLYIAYRDGNDQVHRVESQVINGEVKLPRDLNSESPLVVRLTRLDKSVLAALGRAWRTPGAAASSEVSFSEVTRLTGVSVDVTEQLYDPREVPALDVRVSELKWNNWRFSNVALRSEPSDSGMQIKALTARQDSMRVSGNGYWQRDGNGHATTIDLTASFDDFGRAVTTVADVSSFAAGSGEAALSLTWPSPAYAPDLGALRGQLLFNLRDGRILSVEPGAGRILGLFALQSLPRRLTLDFRDMTDNGLEYSGVSGNLSIANGQATTNAIVMSGPVAEILIHGSTGFVDKTYDQTINVLPRVSGALPLLAVLSGGPAAALTALLADGVLKGVGVNLDEIGRRRFKLTGSWDNPEWTKFTPAVAGQSGQ